MYEILLRWKDGKFSGAHVIEEPNGPPRPINAADWPDMAKAINTEVLIRVDELTMELTDLQEDGAAKDAKLAEVASHFEAIKAAVNDPKVVTDEAVLAIVADATADEVSKKKAELDATIAKLQEQRDAL